MREREEVSGREGGGEWERRTEEASGREGVGEWERGREWERRRR